VRTAAVQAADVIASVAFRNFKALRKTDVALAAFNLVIGPNGSGKTSLIESLLRLKTLAQLPTESGPIAQRTGGPEIEFGFAAPHEKVRARLGCVSETQCDALRIEPAGAPEWNGLREQLREIRGYVLDHERLALPAVRGEGGMLATDGRNLAAVLASLRERAPVAFAALTAELLRIMPEFRALEFVDAGGGRVAFALHLNENGLVPADELSQGMLYLIGMLVLAFDPQPPRVLCIEEVDRGIHPRMLREVRDALYRLSYPHEFGLARPPVQIVATSHSPYFIDLFREHPEEVIISHKHGRAARFSRLSDRPDLPELLQEGSLGDMWFSGILGGVPEENN
jgi:predicted ATPase